jgi:hypothetical protein
LSSRNQTHARRSSTKELISYDTPEIAMQKAKYIDEQGLGGGMWWELDGDRPVGNGSLVEIVRKQWDQLEFKWNELDYPGSSSFSDVFVEVSSALLTKQSTRISERACVIR